MSGPHAGPAPAACWSLLGPPWPARLAALQRTPWRQPHDAWEPAQPLAEFVVLLARQLDPDYPAGLPRPPSRPVPTQGELAVPSRAGRGLAWRASIRTASHQVERRLTIEAAGLPEGRTLTLTWRDLAAPPGAFKSRRELELEAVATPDERRALEAAVEAMLREGRPPAPPSPVRPSPAPGRLRRRDYLLGTAILAALCLAGAGLVASGLDDVRRWRHAGHYVALEGQAVGIRLVTMDGAWSEHSRLGAELAPEVEVSYELGGTRSVRFVDDTIRRQTPAIVRSLGERAWMGRPIVLWADPHRPWAALREKPQEGLPSPWRLLSGALLIAPALVVAGALVRERLVRRTPPSPNPPSSTTGTSS